MTAAQWVQIILGSGGVLGIAFLIFRSGRMAERIDQLYENHLPHIYKEMNQIREDLKTHDLWEREVESRKVAQ